MNSYSNSKASSISSSYDNCDSIPYIQIRILGQGAHGKAVLYRNALDDSLVVWKEINIDNNEKNAIQREIDILSILDHPNIISYFNHFIHLDTVFIEMEYANNGSLANYLKQLETYLTEAEVLWFIFQIIYALKYLHQLNIIHRDLKPLNVFMTNVTLIKIGDFGISKELKEDEMANTQVGTPLYMSPEVIQGLLYTSKSDIWSAGCTLYELMTRKKIFDCSNQLRLATKIVNREFQQMPSNYSTELSDLLNQLLTHHANQRPSANELLEHIVWRNEQDCYIEKIHKLYQTNRMMRPIPGENKERSVVSLNSEVFVWGGGKTYPIKMEQFKDISSPLQVAAGKCHFAVLTIEKELYTWSSHQGNSKLSGQLGHGQYIYKIPKLVSSLKGISIKQVSCAAENTFCLTVTGELFGCGSNYYGQLGFGSQEPDQSSIFVNIPILSSDGAAEKIISFSSGDSHIAALAENEEDLYVWGCGEFGRLGLGNEDDVFRPTQVDKPLRNSKIKLVHCGPDCTFIILKETDRLLACGNNEFNKLGINIMAKGLSGSSQEEFSYDVPYEPYFKLILPLRNVCVSTISCGTSHTAILDCYNKLYIFGNNKYGQLGLGDTKSHPGINLASKILLGKKLERVSCGDYFSFVCTSDNEIFGWGLTDNGRLGVEILRDQKFVVHPKPLFGTLYKCADIKSFGWQSILVAERVLESNIIIVQSSSSIFNNRTEFSGDDLTDNTVTSEMPTWLREEFDEAEVIPMDNAVYDSSEGNQVIKTKQYHCDCNCNKCQDYIMELEKEIERLQNQLRNN